MNRITLIGYLGKDAEQRTTRNNVTFTVLSLATSKFWNDRNGDRQSRTEWHRCVVWLPKLAAFAAGLTKGQFVHVEGELVSREYAKDGVTRRVVEVRTQSILRLNKAGENHAGAAQSA
ncbi:MAG TPA: single-stranded DNA-binding protein [Bryobacteraceae bacterium]|nr:single-stranded DNA-binding protein [Bryobacteraceae bacterium]